MKRREFLTTTASGLGAMALGSLLTDEGLLGAGTRTARTAVNPLSPRAGHFDPKAKACISIFMAGAPSQLDLFDPKPKLNELHGEGLPKSILDQARFAFIKPETATLMGSPRAFKRHGQAGTEFSDLLPHLGSCADDILMIRSMHSEEFNHHPGQLMMQCGVSRFGMPTMGSWMTYALGSESAELPGYVVLTAGRGSSGGATLGQSGFLPSTYGGVLFRNQGEPVLNLKSPDGLPRELQEKGLDVLNGINRRRYDEVHDPEIAARIANYELAARELLAAPELSDLSNESHRTLKQYIAGRPET